MNSGCLTAPWFVTQAVRKMIIALNYENTHLPCFRRGAFNEVFGVDRLENLDFSLLLFFDAFHGPSSVRVTVALTRTLRVPDLNLRQRYRARYSLLQPMSNMKVRRRACQTDKRMFVTVADNVCWHAFSYHHAFLPVTPT